MNDQPKKMRVRSVVLGLACMSLAALAGCAAGVVKVNPAMMTRPSNAEFTIAFDPEKPVDEQVVIDPNDGDASLETVKAASKTAKDNKIIWGSRTDFAIKFVQIDDQTKKRSNRLGNENHDWNFASPDAARGHSYTLSLDDGEGKTKKAIRGAKYVVKSPRACDERYPGPNCMVSDPVLIVRY